MLKPILFSNLALAFIPVLFVFFIYNKWELNSKTIIYATFRMLLQLLLIGYFLEYIFKSSSFHIPLFTLVIMLFSAAWIALRTIKENRKALYLKSLASIVIAGAGTLILITQFVLKLEPWYSPRFMIPLAGMIFANSMNSVSLVAERLKSELSQKKTYEESRAIAFKTSLIPITNALFAVGLVSLPGMMTGQILSGISPFVAARYQIMVMCMLFGSAGISSALFLTFTKSFFSKR